jgi:hypothetical protein
MQRLATPWRSAREVLPLVRGLKDGTTTRDLSLTAIEPL